jgi:hypothetical protein
LIKKCRGCEENKEINEYYAHNRMADGHLNYCKSCVKKRISDQWYNNVEEMRVKDRLRQKERGIDPEYRIKRREYEKTHRTEEKTRASNYVTRKLKDKRPLECSLCGEIARIEGHHEDYGKPLEVIWCCPPCHRQIHLRKRKFLLT